MVRVLEFQNILPIGGKTLTTSLLHNYINVTDSIVDNK